MKIRNPSSFEKYDLRFLKLLEENSSFRKFIFNKRRELDLPGGGIEFNKKNLSCFEDEKFSRKLTSTVVNFLTFLNIPFYWLNTFRFLLLFDMAIPPNRSLSRPIEIKVERTFPRKVSIVIREDLSISKIREFLSTNGEKLETALSDLPKTPEIRMQNVDMMKYILKLKADESLTDKQILHEFRTCVVH